MDNLKTIICCINSKYIHSSLAPWCLFSGTKEYCNDNINAKVLEGTINENYINILNRILGEKPSVVSFCCYIWNITMVYKIIDEIKKESPNTIIIVGGPEVSYNPQEVLTNKNIDYVSSGEGEVSLPKLLNEISIGNLDDIDIDGICYVNNDNKLILSPPSILDCDPVNPYTKEFFDALNGRICYLETSRGCPYSCAFCLSGRCGKARFFDLEQSKKNIIALANSGSKTIKLVDRTFNANKQRAKDLYQFIIDNYKINIPEDVCFHFEIAGDILDEETLNILSTAPVGLMQLEIGMQSFNEKTLKNINRKTDTKKLTYNINRLVENNNMHIHIDLIAGLPYEDFESFKNSFNIGFDLKSNMLQLGFLKLLHGATMRENHKKYCCDFHKTPPYEVVSTPWISETQLNRLHDLEDALDRIHNSGRFDFTEEYVLSKYDLTAFDFFDNFAIYIKNEKIENISLDNYTLLLYNFCKNLNNIDEKALRDCMVKDRLSTNQSGKLPKFLQVEDKKLKKYKNAVKEIHPTIDGIIRSVEILYSENKIVFCDYINKNKSNGKYDLKFIETKDFDI